MDCGKANQPPSGPRQGGDRGQDTQWKTNVFRHHLIKRLEEAIKDSSSQADMNAVDLERCDVFYVLLMFFFLYK